MDYKNLTAPCGRDCFNCYFYLGKSDEKIRTMFARKFNIDPEKVTCEGCKNLDGDCQVLKNYGFTGKCKIYDCFKNKSIDFCYECSDFPCKLLHPLADGADKFPHNLKVFNLCMIQKMGLEKWAEKQAKDSFDRYYNDKLDSCV
jgi:hypothetical protein